MNGISTHLNRLVLLVAVATMMSLGSAAEGPTSLAIVCQRSSIMPSATSPHGQFLAQWLSDLSDAARAFSATPNRCDQLLAYCEAPPLVAQPAQRWCGLGRRAELTRVPPSAPLQPHLTDLPPPSPLT